MRRFAVDALDALLSIVFLVVLIAGMFAGFLRAGVTGAIFGLAGSFLFGIVIFGGLFVLLDINANLRTIRDNLAQAPK